MQFTRPLRSDDQATQHKLLKEFFMPHLKIRNRVEGYGVSIIKAGAKLVGHDAGPVRAPLTRPQACRDGRTQGPDRQARPAIRLRCRPGQEPGPASSGRQGMKNTDHAGAALALAAQAASSFPDKPVNIIVPFPARWLHRHRGACPGPEHGRATGQSPLSWRTVLSHRAPSVREPSEARLRLMVTPCWWLLLGPFVVTLIW